MIICVAVSSATLYFATLLVEALKDRFDYSHCDYTDTCEQTISDPDNRIGIDDVAAAFSGPGPGWVEGLMSLRNRIVSVFGLKTTPPDVVAGQMSAEKWEPGMQAGVFRVLKLEENGMILGEDDKHLDFRVRLSLRPDRNGLKRVSVSTFVRINNRLGRFYFFFVKPFHKIIVPRMMKHNFSRLNENSDRRRVV